MKKLALISALSVSFFIQANTKEVSKVEETKIKKNEEKPIKFTIRCKYNNYIGEAPAGTSFEGLLAIANQVCSTDKPENVNPNTSL